MLHMVLFHPNNNFDWFTIFVWHWIDEHIIMRMRKTDKVNYVQYPKWTLPKSEFHWRTHGTCENHSIVIYFNNFWQSDYRIEKVPQMIHVLKTISINLNWNEWTFNSPPIVIWCSQTSIEIICSMINVHCSSRDRISIYNELLLIAVLWNVFNNEKMTLHLYVHGTMVHWYTQVESAWLKFVFHWISYFSSTLLLYS